ncbi:MAG: hypothetical protein AAFU64_20495 [Bacteroidota bacterium]
MKTQMATLLLLVFSSFTFQQHEIVGTWKYNDPDGNTLMIQFNEDKSYEVDFDNDGAYDLNGTYTTEGTNLTIKDAVGDCQGMAGVYTMTFDAFKLKLSQVSEACPARQVEEGTILEFSRQ